MGTNDVPTLLGFPSLRCASFGEAFSIDRTNVSEAASVSAALATVIVEKISRIAAVANVHIVESFIVHFLCLSQVGWANGFFAHADLLPDPNAWATSCPPYLAKLSLAPLALAWDAIIITIHLGTWAVLNEVCGLRTRCHLGATRPAIAGKRCGLSVDLWRSDNRLCRCRRR